MAVRVGKIIISSGGELPWEHEMFMARALADAGYVVEFKNKDDKNLSADAYLNNVLFEFKSPEGKSKDCIERNLKRAIKQSENIVITSVRVKNIHDRSVQNILIKRLKLKHGIKRMIFVDRKGNVIDINKMI